MFNTAQTDYIKSLVPTMREQGYEYYVAYSDFDRSDNSSPDVYIVFSREKIDPQGLYVFSIPADSVLYSVNSSNYSRTNGNDIRVSITNYNGSTLTVDRWEHIYTNAEFTGFAVQPDITKGTEVQTNETLQAVGIIISVCLLFTVFISFFKR